MNDQCLDPLELDVVLALPDGDPRREHLDRCPRCRGLVHAMDTFLEPGDTSDLGEVAATDSELAARMAGALATAQSPSPRPRMRRLGLAAAAALALVAVGLTASEVIRVQDPAGLAAGQHQRGTDLTGAIAATASEDGLSLSWPTAPLADEVVYVFFTGDMSEVSRVRSPGILNLSADDPLTQSIFCQALAVAQGDTIGRSGISRLTLDRE